MFDDSRALFSDSSSIFSTNFSPRAEQHNLFPGSRMNFDMNNIIQDSYHNNSSSENSYGDSLNSSLSHYSRHSSGLTRPQVGHLDDSSLYRMGTFTGMDDQGRTSAGLMRQNSSPAGFFSHLANKPGYGGMRGDVGNYRLGNGNNGDLISSRLKSQISLSSGMPSSLGMLPRISETEGGNIEPTSNIDTKNRCVNGDTQYHNSGYPLRSWNDTLHFADSYTLKRELDDDDRLFSSIQFKDSVPCKIHAKRGCATHPRSIAERVRRTRISERMRKLQELVPHMDKQTNTADMLDLAVDYIKDLQKQYKTLNDNRANCKCLAMQKQGLK